MTPSASSGTSTEDERPARSRAHVLTNSWIRLQAIAVAGSTSEGLLLAAMPLLAVSITTDPRAVSLVNAVGQAPWLLLSLFAGLLVDRIRRRTLLMCAYGLQLCAALALAAAASSQALTIPLLAVVAFIVTSSQVLGEGATGALVPEIVPAERLPSANARLQVIDQGVVQFVVPPAAGALVAVGLGLPAWAACVMAALALAASRGVPSATVAKARTHPLRDIGEGLRYLVATPLLRSITITVALGSFAGSAIVATLVLYATEVLHIGAVGYGLLLACFAVGWLVSSFVVDRLVALLGYSWAMRGAQALMAVTELIVAVVPAWPVLVGAVLAVEASAVLVWNVCSQSTRQRFTPRLLLGRVLMSHRALAWGLTPLGALAGGAVAAHWNLRGVWVIAGTIQAIGFVVVWFNLSPKAFAHAEREATTQTAQATEIASGNGDPN